MGDRKFTSVFCEMGEQRGEQGQGMVTVSVSENLRGRGGG